MSLPTSEEPGDPFAELPDPLVLPDARPRIRAAREASGRRTAVLDDDPTGSQSVHDVTVVTVLDPDEYAAALADPGATCFVLTNTRSLPESGAVERTGQAGRELLELGRHLQAPVDLVTRSDSTLRGHVIPEIRALQQARTEVLGHGYDGVLLVPAYLEAGRLTAGNIHWARVDGEMVPVGETEFARDATFGYSASDLREFVAERSQGSEHPVRADDVAALSLDDIRRGGPERVAQVLGQLHDGQVVVVNATEYSDLEITVLGLLEAEARGRSYLFRSGPSFVRALAGIDPQEPLSTADVWAGADGERRGGHGLVVVGSHVGLTSRQVAAAQRLGGFTELELDVPALADARSRDEQVDRLSHEVSDALSSSDVLLYTSRTLVRGTDEDDSLAVARATSQALVRVVQAAVSAEPGWVIAKGGITSHDIAVHGLGIRRARVLGQLLPGQVSVFDPVEAAPGVVGMPYVVFAGNVGDEDTLARVVDVMRGSRGADNPSRPEVTA